MNLRNRMKSMKKLRLTVQELNKGSSQSQQLEPKQEQQQSKKVKLSKSIRKHFKPCTVQLVDLKHLMRMNRLTASRTFSFAPLSLVRLFDAENAIAKRTCDRENENRASGPPRSPASSSSRRRRPLGQLTQNTNLRSSTPVQVIKYDRLLDDQDDDERLNFSFDKFPFN